MGLQKSSRMSSIALCLLIIHLFLIPIVYSQDLINVLNQLNADSDLIKCASQSNCENCLNTDGCVVCGNGRLDVTLLGNKQTLSSGGFCWTGGFNRITNTQLEELSTGIEITCDKIQIKSKTCIISDFILIFIALIVFCLFLCICLCCCCRKQNKVYHIHKQYSLIPNQNVQYIPLNTHEYNDA